MSKQTAAITSSQARPLKPVLPPAIRTLWRIVLALPCLFNPALAQSICAGKSFSGMSTYDPAALPASPHFSSIVQAVIAASNQYNPVSIKEDREYMGAILKHSSLPADFIYTAGAGNKGQDNISVTIKKPKNYEIVAFWHTHGAAHWSRRYFSDVDTALADNWQLPFYLADYTGALSVYKPGARKISSAQARRLGLGSKRGYAKGNRVVVNKKPVMVATRAAEPLNIATSSHEANCEHSDFVG